MDSKILNDLMTEGLIFLPTDNELFPIEVKIQYLPFEYKNSISFINSLDTYPGHLFLKDEDSLEAIGITKNGVSYLLKSFSRVLYHFKMNLGIFGEIKETVEGMSALTGVMHETTDFTTTFRCLDKLQVDTANFFGDLQEGPTTADVSSVVRMEEPERLAFETVQKELESLPDYYKTDMKESMDFIATFIRIVKPNY